MAHWLCPFRIYKLYSKYIGIARANDTQGTMDTCVRKRENILPSSYCCILLLLLLRLMLDGSKIVLYIFQQNVTANLYKQFSIIILSIFFLMICKLVLYNLLKNKILSSCL